MGRQRIIPLPSAQATKDLGRTLAPLLLPNAIVALSGPLGAGKTTLVQGIAEGLQVPVCVISPTFVYMNLYEGGRLPLFHFDLYRLSEASAFFSRGFWEFLEQGGVAIVEWPEKILQHLPEQTISIRLEHREAARRAFCQFPEEIAWPD